LARPDLISGASEDEDQSRLEFLLLWSIIEAAARHRLSALKIPPTGRISSSALPKMLLTEGIIEEEDYAVLRRGLAARNAIAHGFLNQVVDPALFEEVRGGREGSTGDAQKGNDIDALTNHLHQNVGVMGTLFLATVLGSHPVRWRAQA
jgi:hypothetical protein